MQGPRQRRLIGWGVLVIILGWFLSLPLRDVLDFPSRLSVLPNLETDAAAYDAFAREFAQTGDIASLPSKHPPGWMVMLAAVYRVAGHSYVAGKMISLVALVLIVFACAWLAHRVFGRTAAIITALLCASSPGLRAYVGTLQYEVVTGALFAIFLLYAVRSAHAHTRAAAMANAALAGSVAAVLILTRETFVLVVPLSALWLWAHLRTAPTFAPGGATVGKPSAPGAPGAPWIPPLLMLTMAAMPAILWSAAQSVQHQRVILIADKAREVFDAGNNSRANGTYNEPLVGIGQPAGVAFIREFPEEFVRLSGRKLLYSFGILRDGWNVPHPAAIWIWRATTGAVPLHVIEPVVRGGWLLALCIAGLLVLGRHGLRRWWLLPATVCAILAVHAITLASYRFAIPLLPILYVIASGPLARLGSAAASAMRTPAIAVGCALIAAIAIAAQWQHWPLQAHYLAVDLEGLAAANAVDPSSGMPVRVADAEHGERPVALLPDTYLPRGRVRVTTRVRRTMLDAQDATPVVRIMLVPLDARSPCVVEVLAAQLPMDRFADIAMLCTLEHDGPVTLAVASLGQVDLAIESLELSWMKNGGS